MRSTTAPEMSAAAMMANVPWKAMNSRCGIVPLGLEIDAGEEHVVEAAEEGIAGCEGQAVPERGPTGSRPHRARRSS